MKNHFGNGGIEYEYQDMKKRLKTLKEEFDAEHDLYWFRY